jgi:hypothetical protein
MDVSSPGNETDTRISPRSAIDETRSQLKSYMMAEEDLKEFENREECRELMESETDEEENKNVFTGRERVPEKDNKLRYIILDLIQFRNAIDTSAYSVGYKKAEDLAVVQERESEYYGSNLTNQHEFGFNKSTKGKSLTKSELNFYKSKAK